MRDTARYLGVGVANLLNIFNPDVVVIAGGVTQAGDALFVPLRAEVRRRAFRPAVEAADRARRAARHGRRRRRRGDLQACSTWAACDADVVRGSEASVGTARVPGASHDTVR